MCSGIPRQASRGIATTERTRHSKEPSRMAAKKKATKKSTKKAGAKKK
jgi:hypothetical protein